MPDNFPFNKNSFTLVEILVVVSILAILAASTMPALVGYASERSVSRVAQLVSSDLALARNKSLAGALDVYNRGDWAIQFQCGSPTYELGVREVNSFISLESKSVRVNFTFRWGSCGSGEYNVLFFERLTGQIIDSAGTPVPRNDFTLYYRYDDVAARKKSDFTVYQNGKINVQ